MPRIIDSTLREGEQTPGVSFSLAEKRRIIDGLRTVGIEEIELGIVSSLDDDPAQLLRYCRRKHPLLTCSLWSRCLEEDIHRAAAMGPDILALSVPVSDLLLAGKMTKDRHWAKARMTSSVLLAKKLGLAVSIGLEDATRADIDFLKEMAALAESSGAMRIRLADTVGICSPLTIARLVQHCKEAIHHCEVGVHTHNDFGMATANAITALEAGADTADVTVLGLGERSGCARLEEVIGHLALVGRGTYRTEALQPLAGYVADRVGKKIAPDRPLLGGEIFTCESGLHLLGLHNDPRTYEPYPPEKVGARRKLLTGSKMGRGALTRYLSAQGYKLEKDITDDEMKRIRRFLHNNTNADAEQIYRVLLEQSEL